MTDYLPSTISQLEILPNELFLEIFRYMDPSDLQTFKGLNKRIDCIIQAVKIALHVRDQEENSLEYFSNFSASQIVRLEVHGAWPSMNLHAMTELRSLILDLWCLSQEQQDQVMTCRQVSWAMINLCVRGIWNGQ